MDAWFRNAYLMVFVVLTLTAFTLYQASHLLGVHYPSGVTHLVVVLLFVILWYHYGGRLDFPPFYRVPLAAMALFVLAGYGFTHGSLQVYVLGTAFTYLFVLVFLLSYNLRLDVGTSLEHFKTIFILVPFLSSVTVLDVVIHRVPFREAATLVREPGAYTGLLIYGIILGLSLFTIYKGSKYLVITGGMSFLVAISTYKKALVTLVVVWFLYFLMEKNWTRRVVYFYLFALAAVAGYLLVGEKVAQNISYNAELYADKSDTIARAVLIQTAFLLAVKNFPFGSGLGTFASIPSVNVNYSDIYYQYGMDKVWGLGPDAADKGILATLDCYWAHILGELGFVGSLIFLGLWFYPAFNAWFLRRKPRTELERALRFFVLAMTGVMTLDGLGYYYAENPAFIIVHAGLMGLALRLLELAEAVDQEAPPDEGEKAAEAAQEGA